MANNLYNNGFPVGYPYYQIPQQQNNNNTNINVVWVMGLDSAKSYLLAPNQTAFLFDTEDQFFYIKKSDQNGRPTSFQAFEYKEVQPSTNEIKQEQIVPAIDVEKIEKQLKSLNSKITELENNYLDIATSPDNKKKEGDKK